MKYLKVLITLVLFSTLLHAQVGINNTSPNASLDISATNQANPSNTDGLLIPRVDSFPAINPSTAQQGMMVYLTTTSGSNPPGFYYWDNNAGPAAWVSVVGGTVEKLNDLLDGKSDNDGSNDGSSIFLGVNSGLNDDSSHNKNVGIGFQSLKTNTTGDLLTAVGYNSLLSNTGGSYNIAVGYMALYSNTTGYGNTAIGSSALLHNTFGATNNANGYQSLYSNTTGIGNTANGYQSLVSNTTGHLNTGLGKNALYQNTMGSYNTAIGGESLFNNRAASRATAVGYRAMFNANPTTAFTINGNVALGYEALRGYSNPSANTGNFNTALGYQTLINNRSGGANNANGYQALFKNVIGTGNVANGYRALYNNTSGQYNTAIGYQSGYNTTGNSNVFIGYLAGASETGSNKLYIENTSANPNNALIYGEFDTNKLRVNGQLQIKNPAVSGYAFPTMDGAANQVLSTNGSGQISFVDASSVNDNWVNVGADIERQSGNVYIGNTNTTDNDLYISDRIVDWDSSMYYLDPDNISRVDEIEFDGGSASDPSIRFSDSGTGFYSPSYQTTAFSTNGSEVFRINNAGNMRIGTTNNIVDYKLIVNSATNNVIFLGAQNSYNSSVRIDHVSDTGDGLEVNVTNSNTSISRSAISAYNGLGGISTNIARYTSTRIYGVENWYNYNNSLDIYGVYNFITGSGSGATYGIQNRLLGSGSGTKYGSYNIIPSSAGGTHYGVYSSVAKAGSYAGYFLGRVSIGTTGVNNYIFPASRGTNGQIMQASNSTGDISWVDSSSMGTDDQNITGSSLSGTNLTIGIESGTSQTIDLSSLQDGTGTDNQNIIGSSLSGTNLTIGIESGTSQTIDLSSLQDGTGTDNQNITGSGLSGTNLTIGIESGTSQTIDLSPLQDADWFKSGGATPSNNINDNIYTNGNVGIGASTPVYKLDVRKSITADYVAQIFNTSVFSNADGLKIKLNSAVPNSLNNFIGFYNGSNATRGKISGSATGVTYATTSDRRLKTKIVNIVDALDLISKIQPRKYEYKANLGTSEYGFIAQELQLIYPQAVIGNPESNVETDPMMVDYSRLTPILAAGIKELDDKVTLLEIENKKLKNKLSKYEQLEARLSALENKTSPPNPTDLAANK